MTNLALAALSLAVIAGLIAWAVWWARRQGADQARTTALSQAQAQTIKNERVRDEIDVSVNADAGLVERARRAGIVRPDPGK